MLPGAFADQLSPGWLLMDEDQAECYDDLEEALLQKFDIATETYCQRF